MEPGYYVPSRKVSSIVCTPYVVRFPRGFLRCEMGYNLDVPAIILQVFWQMTDNGSVNRLILLCTESKNRCSQSAK